MIGHKEPGEAISTGLEKKFGKALYRSLSSQKMSHQSKPRKIKVRNIKAGGCWHAGKIDYVRELANK